MTAGGRAAGTMRAVAVAGCLGWLHRPPAGQARGRAVLLCAPFGQEALATRRGLYDLAAQCAAAGLPALRLDYPGCGDSPGEPGPRRIAACRRAILEASDWLRRHAGVEEVALAGLRLGALLAADAAAERPGGIAGLALLAPVASGRVHVRQLRLMAETATAPCPAGAEWLEAGGDRLHAADLAELERIELAAVLRAARPGRLLLLECKPGLAARLREAGEVTALPFTGADAFFAPAHRARLPRAEFAHVAAWLAEGAPAALPASLPAGRVELEAGPGLMERPLRFGPRGGLAGVLCSPPDDTQRRVGVLLLNTGANPRAGVGGLGARMARHLAAAGFCTLRLDATGIGDSDAAEGADPAAPPDLFDAGIVRDAGAGLDALAAQGARGALVIGICAGAHAAFQLALRDERVRGLALFNLPAFDREAGGAPSLDGGPPPGERPWMRRPRMLLRRLRAKADMAVAEWLALDAGLDRACFWMRGLAARGTRVLLGYSERDRGLRELRAHFGRGGHALARLPGVSHALLAGTDHSLAPRAMQDQALELVMREALILDRAAAPAREATAPEARAAAEPAFQPGPMQGSRA